MIEGFAREMPEDDMVEAIARSASTASARSATCSTSWSRKVGVTKAEYDVPPDDGAARPRCDGQYYDALQGGQADRGQAGPGRSRRRSSRQRVMAEMIPDPAAEGAISRARVRHRLARPGRARRPRPDSGRHAARRPRRQDAASHRVPRRRAAARPRLGRLPARRNAGADHRHAGHRPRRAARRRPDRRVLQEVHARLQLPARSRSAKCGRFAARAAAKSVTGRWPSGASSRCCPIPKSFPTRSA